MSGNGKALVASVEMAGAQKSDEYLSHTILGTSHLSNHFGRCCCCCYCCRRVFTLLSDYLISWILCCFCVFVQVASFFLFLDVDRIMAPKKPHFVDVCVLLCVGLLLSMEPARYMTQKARFLN